MVGFIPQPRLRAHNSCQRHPFHLRPKDGQLVHCLRVAGDIIHDLHLDEDASLPSDPLCQKMTDNELDKIRAYLAYLYLSSV